MIYSTLIAPSETAPRLTDVKRALLTFDRVLIPEPQDRDFIPPQAFLLAMGMPPIFAINAGPVRPIGKMRNFDSSFDQLMELCVAPRRGGIIDIISSYQHSNELTLGMVPMGDYPLNPQAMLLLFRSMASSNDYLLSSIKGDPSALGQDADYLNEIAIPGCSADGGINDDPAMPLIEGEMARPELREPLTLIARGRLATVLKTIGYCAAKDIVPFFSHSFYNRVAQQILSNATRFVDDLSTHDPFWTSRSLALRVAHDEYVDEDVLEEMSVADVVKLRTKIWGQKAEARDELLRSVAAISKEAGAAADFEAKCREMIQEYRIEAEKLEHDWSSLKFKVKCEVGLAMAAIGSAVGAGSVAQIQSGLGVATILLAGCAYAMQRLKEYGSAIIQLKAAEEEFKDSAGFGLHQFYKEISLPDLYMG